LRTSALVLLGCFHTAACSSAAGGGASAWLQVDDATYAKGALVDGQVGPPVLGTYARTSWIAPGQDGTLLNGTLGPGATAVLLGLTSDEGYWILPAAAPDTQTPDQPRFFASLGFSTAIAATELQLHLVAVDAAGLRGPASTVSFGVLPAVPPSGGLVVELAWDTEADLDLHVIDPLDNELWAGDIVSPQPDPATGTTQGVFGFDSNANCLIDGKRAETVAWSMPPTGAFTVQVDAYSLCQAQAAHWKVFVLREGAIRMQAQGVATPADARFAKGRRGGVEVLSFDWQ